MQQLSVWGLKKAINTNWYQKTCKYKTASDVSLPRIPIWKTVFHRIIVSSYYICEMVEVYESGGIMTFDIRICDQVQRHHASVRTEVHEAAH